MIDFAKLQFDELTTDRLFEFCMSNRLGLASSEERSNLKPANFKFHVTIMYSKVKSLGFKEGEMGFGPHVLIPEAFDMFGPENDILVLKLRRDNVLEALFDHYRDTYGHVSDFMPFQPHISIRGSSVGVRDRIASLPMPHFDLRADRLVQKVKSA
jgi:2'-5' RNA ligase